MSRSTSPRISEIFPMKLERREIVETATIGEAIEIMKSLRYNCLLVKSAEGKSIGILSEHDIVSAFAEEGDNAKHARVADFMTLDIICATDDQTLDEVIRMMAENNIRHIPILSQGGYVVSFLSIMELLMAKMTCLPD